MEIIYRNHLGEEIDLNSDNISLQNTDIFNWEYSYTTLVGKRAKSTDFKRDPVTFKLELLLVPDLSLPLEEKVDYKGFLNNKIFKYTHKDVVSQKKGRLYVGEYYVECVVVGSEKIDPLKSTPYHLISLKLLADNPNFVKENIFDFPINSASSIRGLTYNYDYGYDYTNQGNGNLNITRSHFAESEFKLSIFGAVSNPRIFINDNIYVIKEDISAGEVIEVSSRDFKVIKRKINGEEENIFDKRDIQNNVFKKIPGGNLNINWSGDFGFELVIYEERSEYGYFNG